MHGFINSGFHHCNTASDCVCKTSNCLLVLINFLTKESEDLERQNAALRREIKQLTEELKHFSTMLNSHETHCSILTTQPPAPSELLYTQLSFHQAHISAPCFQHWNQLLGLERKEKASIQLHLWMVKDIRTYLLTDILLNMEMFWPSFINRDMPELPFRSLDCELNREREDLAPKSSGPPRIAWVYFSVYFFYRLSKWWTG